MPENYLSAQFFSAPLVWKWRLPWSCQSSSHRIILLIFLADISSFRIFFPTLTLMSYPYFPDSKYHRPMGLQSRQSLNVCYNQSSFRYLVGFSNDYQSVPILTHGYQGGHKPIEAALNHRKVYSFCLIICHRNCPVAGCVFSWFSPLWFWKEDLTELADKSTWLIRSTICPRAMFGRSNGTNLVGQNYRHWQPASDR